MRFWLLVGLFALLPAPLLAVDRFLTWEPPTAREDGSPFDPATEIDRYMLQCGDQLTEIPGQTPGSGYAIDQAVILPGPMVYDCTLAVVDTGGLVSGPSQPVSVAWETPPTLPAKAPTSFIMLTSAPVQPPQEPLEPPADQGDAEVTLDLVNPSHGGMLTLANNTSQVIRQIRLILQGAALDFVRRPDGAAVKTDPDIGSNNDDRLGSDVTITVQLQPGESWSASVDLDAVDEPIQVYAQLVTAAGQTIGADLVNVGDDDDNHPALFRAVLTTKPAPGV